MLGAQSIQLGINDCIVAGGMESMSNIPHYLKGSRLGLRMGHGQVSCIPTPMQLSVCRLPHVARVTLLWDSSPALLLCCVSALCRVTTQAILDHQGSVLSQTDHLHFACS